jgi:site-specific recombinase XerD
MNEKDILPEEKEVIMDPYLSKGEDSQPYNASFAPFPTTPQVPDNDLFALITDFFDWLEKAWKLPILTPDMERPPLPQPLALTEEEYTIEDLVGLYGYPSQYVHKLLQDYYILPVRPGKSGSPAIYRKHDLAPLIEQWEWKRLIHTLYHWWLRFSPPVCENCDNCRKIGRTRWARQMWCKRNFSIALLHSVFAHFLEEVHHHGSVSAWWGNLQTPVWDKRTCSAWGIVFIYLLDRRLLHLSNDELLQLEPVCNRGRRQDLMRLWSYRRPEEYNQFMHALDAANYRAKKTQEGVLSTLCLLVLLKHGLPGIAELGRNLTSEEIRQVCSERRLVTLHLGWGVYLPYPLIDDVRVGHVVLDDIRHFIWRYAASHPMRSGRQEHWDIGPRYWRQSAVSVLEKVLAAPMYGCTAGILSRRPETEQPLVSPWRISQKGKLDNTGYALLPFTVQEHVMTYVTYMHQEQHAEIRSLQSYVQVLLHFFTWLRTQEKLANYPHWTRQYAQEAFNAYASIGCATMLAADRRKQLQHLAHFFVTLDNLEYPVPEGYRLLYTLEKSNTWHPRAVPREEIMDRVFKEGVCNLSYDPFARLALTIQYYCGTRVTETLDLHLLCVLEDQHGHAYLLIPRGKSKQERPFPIVELGMGPLFTFMEEIIDLRLSSDKTTPLTLGKANIRYQDDSPERAKDWHYLFDRSPSDDGRVKKHGRLSKPRVNQALREALRIAAKTNPHGLFQQETYNIRCRYQRRKGQRCNYFAAEEGITTCPCCGSILSGRLGERCYHVLKEDFTCDGVARHGEAFCPKCDTPFAEFLPITSHVFRHNSVSRAHRAGVPLAQNMTLHGHQTIPMHLRYLHLFIEDMTDEVRQIFAEKRLRDVRQTLGSAPGQIVKEGVAYTVSLEDYLSITLQRMLKRRTFGIWGGFWAGALALRGVASPLPMEDDIVILEDTYEHTVAQYWYEALGLAVSEVAFERITKRKWRADVPLQWH